MRMNLTKYMSNIYHEINLVSWNDFIFLYLLLRRRRRYRYRSVPLPAPPPPAADFGQVITPEQLFGLIPFCMIYGAGLQITLLNFGQFSSWPWPWISKAKYGICFISVKNGLIDTKRK